MSGVWVLTTLTPLEQREVENELMDAIGCSPKAARVVVGQILTPLLDRRVAEARSPLQTRITAAETVLAKIQALDPDDFQRAFMALGDLTNEIETALTGADTATDSRSPS